MTTLSFCRHRVHQSILQYFVRRVLNLMNVVHASVLHVLSGLVTWVRTVSGRGGAPAATGAAPSGNGWQCCHCCVGSDGWARRPERRGSTNSLHLFLSLHIVSAAFRPCLPSFLQNRLTLGAYNLYISGQGRTRLLESGSHAPRPPVLPVRRLPGPLYLDHPRQVTPCNPMRPCILLQVRILLFLRRSPHCAFAASRRVMMMWSG